MGKIIEVRLDDTGRTTLVEVHDQETFGGGVLVPISTDALKRASRSVRSAIDEVIIPTVETIFERLSHGVHQPESVELEFGLKFAGQLGAVVAATKAEGHVNVKMVWRRPSLKQENTSGTESGQPQQPEQSEEPES